MSSVLKPASRAFSTSSRQLASLRRGYATPTQDIHPPSKDPMLNGYPEVPYTNYQLRNPKGWEDIQDRRNINEVVPEQFEALSMWTPDPPTIATKESAARQIGVAVLAFVAFGFTMKAIAPERVSAPRSYPYDGLKAELGGIEQNKARPESIEGDDE